MERVKVDSSMIKSVGHEESTLEVEFTTGAVYQYHGVSEHIHQELMQADSTGKAFNRLIRGNYNYEKVS